MKYLKEHIELITKLYESNTPVESIAEELSAMTKEVVPVRSVIAKLSSLGIYRKQEYLTKRGEVPVKKAEIIEKLSVLLEVSPDLLESLEKVNKSVLILIETKLRDKKSPNVENNIWG